MLALQITLFIVALVVLFVIIVTAVRHDLNGKGFCAFLLSVGYIIWCIISLIIHFMG